MYIRIYLPVHMHLWYLYIAIGDNGKHVRRWEYHCWLLYISRICQLIDE